LAKVKRIKGGSVDRRDIRKILLIQFGDLGDVIVTFPCMRAIREAFPDARLVMAVHEKANELARGCEWIDDVISADTQPVGPVERLRRSVQFALDVRRTAFDLVFDLRTGDRSAVLSLLTGAKQRVSFYGKYNTLWRNRIYTHLVFPDKSPDLHIVAYYLSLLNAYGIDTDNRIPSMRVTDAQSEAADALFDAEGIPSAGKVIAFHPFSLWEYKNWALENHAVIMDWVAERFEASVVIAGTADQRDRAEWIVQRCNSKVFNLAGKTPLALLPAILRRCAASIGVDTAGGHIAAAVGTPTVTVFGPGNFHQWAPMGIHSKVVHKRWECVPCGRMGCDGNRKSRCLDELTASEVKSEIEDFLNDILSPISRQPTQ
jgi:heptosyltransferase-3